MWPQDNFSGSGILTSTVALLLLLIAGCDGSSSDQLETGFVNIDITDAPVDIVTEVWVEFSGVAIKPRDAGILEFEFNEPLHIDLLTLRGENTSSLLTNQAVPRGSYNWIRLAVNADADGVFDSYIMTETGAMMELVVTSQEGLQLGGGFTITSGQASNFVIDWDLRKGLTRPNGQDMEWMLRPALRITDLAESGTISGMVDEGMVTGGTCTSNLAEDTGNSVYIFDGHDATLADIQTGASDVVAVETDPVVTAAVTQDENGLYSYSAAYMSTGDYTVAFTCQSLNDEPGVIDGLEFSEPQNVTVNNGLDTTADF
jgi:hypothetical protein